MTFQTKMNSIDADVIQMLHDATDEAEQNFTSMLITNTGEHFCVGANLFLVAMAAGQKQWDRLRDHGRALPRRHAASQVQHACPSSLRPTA